MVFVIVSALQFGSKIFNDRVINKLPVGSEIESQSTLATLLANPTTTKLESETKENTTDIRASSNSDSSNSPNRDKDTETTNIASGLDSMPLITSEDERNLLNASTLLIFDQDSTILTEATKQEIRKFYRTAATYNDFEVTIKGVALKLIDESKSAQNAKLRAMAVSDYLQSLGFDASLIRIETKIVNSKEYHTDQLSKAISAELYFTGYQKEVK